MGLTRYPSSESSTTENNIKRVVAAALLNDAQSYAPSLDEFLTRMGFNFINDPGDVDIEGIKLFASGRHQFVFNRV